MKNYLFGDIVLLSFPFADSGKVKRRPALVFLDTNDNDIVVARITSQSAYVAWDVEVIEWQKANLLLPSIVRVHKIATLGKNLIERKLGKLVTNDLVQVQIAIHNLWKSIIEIK